MSFLENTLQSPWNSGIPRLVTRLTFGLQSLITHFSSILDEQYPVMMHNTNIYDSYYIN